MGYDRPRMTDQEAANLLHNMIPALKKVLPDHMKPERFNRIVLGEMRTNPLLFECTRESIGAAVMKAAQLNLEPGVIGHCYLLPFSRTIKQGGRKEYIREVQLLIGYKGYIELAKRGGEVLSITAMEVKENDLFAVSYGTNEVLEHVPAISRRGETIAYYAYARLKRGSVPFIVRNREEIQEHALEHSKSQYEGQLSGNWKKNFDSMAKKTVITELLKYLPLSVDAQKALQSDHKIMAGVEQTEDGIQVIEQEPSEAPIDFRREQEKKEQAQIDQQNGADWSYLDKYRERPTSRKRADLEPEQQRIEFYKHRKEGRIG